MEELYVNISQFIFHLWTIVVNSPHVPFFSIFRINSLCATRVIGKIMSSAREEFLSSSVSVDRNFFPFESKCQE